MILIDPGEPALTNRLSEEIQSLGLQVAVVAAQRPERPLEVRARAAGAVAAIRVTLAGPGAVEMTIVDRATGKTVSRRFSIATPNDPAATELIALRTVELLRASLMELSAAHPTRGDLPATVDLSQLETVGSYEVESGALSLGGGSAIVYGLGFGSSVNLWGALTVLTRDGVGLTAQTVQPVSGHRLSRPEGTIEVLASQYSLGTVLEIRDPRLMLSSRFAAGLMVAHLTVTGSASAPYVGAHDEHLAWGPWLWAGLRLELTRHFGAVVGGGAAFAFPRTVIRAAGHEVATWGRPVASGTLGLDCTWR